MSWKVHAYQSLAYNVHGEYFSEKKIMKLNKIPCSDVAEHNESKMLNLLLKIEVIRINMQVVGRI